MYNVNLLPSEYRMLHQSARKNDSALIISIIAMCSFLTIYLVLTFIAGYKANELKLIKTRNSAVLNQITESSGVKALNEEVGGLLDIAVSASGTNPSWDRLIADIGNTVPETVGLTSLNMKFNNGAGECTIQGAALDHQSVSSWIKTLEDAKFTGEIRCRFSQASQESSIPVQFEISFSLLPGEGYKFPAGVTGNEQ